MEIELLLFKKRTYEEELMQIKKFKDYLQISNSSLEMNKGKIIENNLVCAKNNKKHNNHS